MTQKEYLNNEVENLINNVIIPIMVDSNKNIKSKAKADNKLETQGKMSIWGLLYSSGRMSALELLMRISRELDAWEYKKVLEYFKEKGE